MIRIGRAQISYRGGDRSVGRAASLSQKALALVAERARPKSSGRIGRLEIEVRVKRGQADQSIAERIADALARRL